MSEGNHRAPTIVVVGFVGAVLLVLARTLARVAAAWPFSTDDAYITLRYARHLLAGEGLVWNLGEAPVEGYSNFLYVLIAAAFGLLGELDVAPLKLLGVAGLLATGYLQWAIARRFVGPLPALLPFAIFSVQRGAIWWSVSGLETGVYVALSCGVVLASLRGLGFGRVDASAGLGLVRGPLSRRDLALAGALCVLASLLRPEGPLLAIAVVVAIAVQRLLDGPGEAAAYRRGAIAFALAFGPAIVAYFAWRYASFGALVPNTVRCKTGHADRFVLLRDYWQAAPLALVFALIQPLRSLDARVLLPAAVVLAYALALIGADPLVAHDLRHFLAAHALVCVLASVAAVRVAGLVAAGWDARRVELALLVAVLLGAGILGELPSRDELRSRAEGYIARSKARAELGRHLAREVEPGERAVLGDVGVAGWIGDAPILDALCLNEPALARPPLRGSSTESAAWILDQRPALIVVHTASPTKLEPRGAIFRELVADPRFAAGWVEQRRFNAKGGRFHYVVFRRAD